jgi:hypothetical protein
MSSWRSSPKNAERLRENGDGIAHLQGEKGPP